MSDKKTSNEKFDQLLADTRRYQDERAKSYRERALKMYPWICGRCAREFNRKNISARLKQIASEKLNPVVRQLHRNPLLISKSY